MIFFSLFFSHDEQQLGQNGEFVLSGLTSQTLDFRQQH